MIQITNGNLLDMDVNIICHQVNCMGVMGAGLAKQIKIKYPSVYEEYKKKCLGNKNKLLGTVDFEKTSCYIIANCFGQFYYGKNAQQTDYQALENCLKIVKKYATEHNLKRIGIPYNMGCGMAGGNWEEVINIILKVFDKTDLLVSIVKLL